MDIGCLHVHRQLAFDHQLLESMGLLLSWSGCSFSISGQYDTFYHTTFQLPLVAMQEAQFVFHADLKMPVIVS